MYGAYPKSAPTNLNLFPHEVPLKNGNGENNKKWNSHTIIINGLKEKKNNERSKEYDIYN